MVLTAELWIAKLCDRALHHKVSSEQSMTMRLPRFRVRTLMGVVVVVALLLWGAMMGSRSYDHSRRARIYGEQERGWREIAARKHSLASFAAECAEYYAQLARKYRRAMWRPW